MSNIIATDLQGQEVDSALIELFEVEMPDGSWLYFHPGLDLNLENVQFKDVMAPYTVNSYEPMPMLIDGLDLQADGATSRPSLTVANVGTLLREHLGVFKNDDLIGQRIRRRRTLAKYLAGASADTASNQPSIEFPRQEYIIDRIGQETPVSITFEVAVPFDLEGIQIPRRVVVGKYCSWKYQGHDLGKGGGCTWLANSNIKYTGSDDEVYTHRAYFTADDNPLIATTVSKPDWNSSTAYTSANYVTYSSKIWQCLIGNTGQTPTASSPYWKEAYTYTTYNPGTTYAAGSRVTSAGIIWRALRTSLANTPVNKSAFWVRDELCGKTLNSCKCRFGFVPQETTGNYKAPNGITNTAARLPFGSFPGTQKF